MGNLQATSSHVSNRTSNGVTISTRSEPIAGQRVIQELAIVFSNSQSFTRGSGPAGEALCYQEAFQLLGLKCAALGGNAVLGTHVEVKQLFGDGGSFMVVICTGTACIVAAGG
jgi:Putative heavy-metal-binding